MFRLPSIRFQVAIATLCLATAALAQQQVCLPAPRLLTIMPMGGQAGTSVEVAITGENFDEANDLLFSTPKVSAQPKLGADGKAEPGKFLVTIAKDAPLGVCDARVMTRLGVSSARAFSVSPLPEVVRVKPNQSLATALELKPNSICNAAMTKRAIDFYAFEAKKGERVVVDCAAAGIDSKLIPVLIVADAQGRDLQVNRTGGAIDFLPPADGRYIVKVNSLTYQGGPEQFYRLALIASPGTDSAPRLPKTNTVSSFSWDPNAAANLAKVAEKEPNDRQGEAQKITPPCVIDGRFFPAADVDTYEFAAKKGETWWVEVGSERLGLPTDPFVLVQRVTTENGHEKLVDLAEINDIPAPMKPSTNGYSYDGPPYDAGSADPLGKIEIKEDGTYRLQIRDLFGGTRNDFSNVYRLIVRKEQPDFALVSWALHMTLRNGDRNALSKPIALRGGITLAFEVVTVRKDGFNGEIELSMEGLPAGVTATGLKIPAGKNKGMMLITAAEDAPRGFSVARLIGRAQINGATVTRQGRMASMMWPVRDASQEIPKPRLMADIPVSVGGSEQAPLTISAAEKKVWEATAGGKLTIPLKATWRSDFIGTSIKLKAYGDGFETLKEFELPVKAATGEAVLDLATLKTPPGSYALAFYGSGVARYIEHAGTSKPAANAAPKDTVDIVVSEPIQVVIKPAAVAQK